MSAGLAIAARIRPRKSDLFLQIDMHHIVHGQPQKSAAHPLEFFSGVGGVELEARRNPSLGLSSRSERLNLELARDLLRGGFRRIDNSHVSRRDPAEQRPDERVMR